MKKIILISLSLMLIFCDFALANESSVKNNDLTSMQEAQVAVADDIQSKKKTKKKTKKGKKSKKVNNSN